MLPDLRAHTIQFIVGTLIPSRTYRDLDECTLDTKRLTLVARNGHPLSEFPSIEWKNLSAWPSVLPTNGSPLRLPLEEVFQSHGMPIPQHCLETTSTQLIRSFVSMTDAIAFMPSDAAEYFDNAGLLRALPIWLDGIVKPTGVIWIRDRALNTLERSFLQYLQKASHMSNAKHSNESGRGKTKRLLN